MAQQKTGGEPVLPISEQFVHFLRSLKQRRTWEELAAQYGLTRPSLTRWEKELEKSVPAMASERVLLRICRNVYTYHSKCPYDLGLPRKTCEALEDRGFDHCRALKGERFLEDYCRYHLEKWKVATNRDRRAAKHEDHDELSSHRLDCYVEPHYGVYETGRPKVQAGSISHAEAQPDSQEIEATSYRRVKGGIEELVTQYLIGTESGRQLRTRVQRPRWLCISEDAGAGKTVFSYRLRALFCDRDYTKGFDGDKPWLAVRVERWRKQVGVKETLVNELAAAVGQNPEAVEPVVEYALDQSRVVLIVDALDQQHDEVIDLLNELREDSVMRDHIYLVVTSRLYKVAEHRGLTRLFNDPRWHYGCVELFDDKQQQEYFTDLAAEALETLIPKRESVSHLLRFPVVVRMVRELIEEHNGDAQLTPFYQRADLYYRVAKKLMERALMGRNVSTSSGVLESLLEAISVYAFEMMLDDEHRRHYTVRDKIDDFHDKAADRYARGVSRREQRWEKLYRHEVLTNTLLTDRCVLEANNDQMLGFRTKKWLEFMAGLHLARFASDSSAAEAKPYANDPDWYWSWRFAIELATTQVPGQAKPFDGEVLRRSLSALFANPTNGNRRPAELIYRAWHLFEVDALVLHHLPFIDSPGDPLADDDAREQLEELGRRLILPAAGETILAFRQPFQQCLADEKPSDNFTRSRASIARELLDSFTACPPEGWRHSEGSERDPHEFWMGSPAGVARYHEGPRHRVSVRPFLLQSTAVTREQYRLFDISHDTLEDDCGKTVRRYSRDDRCPVVLVDWYAAFAFGKFLGSSYRVPTETEWEFACRAGTASAYWFGDDPDELEHHAWYRRNSRNQTHPSLLYTTEIREDEPPHCNKWKLHDMHGNIWEWCWDWFGDNYQRRTCDERDKEISGADSGPKSGSSHVLRGGSFLSHAEYCRSAYRYPYGPRYLNGLFGFRLCRV